MEFLNGEYNSWATLYVTSSRKIANFPMSLQKYQFKKIIEELETQELLTKAADEFPFRLFFFFFLLFFHRRRIKRNNTPVTLAFLQASCFIDLSRYRYS